jgi:hypothetical protein
MTERDWTTRTPEPGASIRADGFDMTCDAPAGATLISGDLEAAVAALAPGAPILGLLAKIPSGPFALRIARDRMLLCTPEPLQAEGWHASYAASAADDLYLAVTITGPRAPEIASACMTADAGSPSAATVFAGHSALIARVTGGISVRVQHPEAAAVWARLEALSKAL